jgi:hypothetical protein
VLSRSDMLEVDRRSMDLALDNHYTDYAHEQSSNDLAGIALHDRSHDPPDSMKLPLPSCLSPPCEGKEKRKAEGIL